MPSDASPRRSQTTTPPPAADPDAIRRALVETKLMEYALAERKLAAFMRAAWLVLEPGRELKWNWHHSLMCEYLEAFFAGEVKRLVMNLPPRNSKSTFCTIGGPVWCWTSAPGKRFLFGAYSDRLSTKHSMDRRALIRSAWFQEGWGARFSLAMDQDKKTEFQNDKRGHMIATSMQGTATGLGGDFVMIDDPHNPKRADSDPLREADILQFDQTFSQRLDDAKTGGIMITMQRLHEGDLSGHVLGQALEGDLKYTHVKIPGIAEQRTFVQFPRSGRVVTREEGTALHPERQPLSYLESQKITLRSAGFAAQINQDPSSASSEFFPAKGLGFWHTVEGALPPIDYPTAKVILLPKAFDRHIQSWDFTFKETRKSDFVVGQAWARLAANHFLLDQYRKQAGFTASKKAVLSFIARHPETKEKLFEDAANGPGLQDDLKESVPGILLYPVEGMSKPERARQVEHLWEAGNVWLPHPDMAPWVLDFLERLFKFPRIKLDDEVDALTQALRWFDKKSRQRGAGISFGADADMGKATLLDF